jgi:AraC-like DNA-binding protein
MRGMRFTDRLPCGICTRQTLATGAILLGTDRLDEKTDRLEALSMDLLSPLFARFMLSARVFYTGALCGIVDFDNTQGIGILHVLRRGRLRVVRRSAPSLDIDEPTLLFYRQPVAHRFEVDAADGADLVCAFIDFGASVGNPLLRGLPDLLTVPMARIAGVESALALLFDEAFTERSGREAAIDRLVEYFVVLLLRYSIEARLIQGGVLAALADARLAKAMMAMHERPEHGWSLNELAQVAGMSRARFAVNFRATVGMPPLDYLTEWRISVAQTLLKRGKPLKAVAPLVGYSSPAALARVFARRVGLSPVDWLVEPGAG